jgi:hypothetical protein
MNKFIFFVLLILSTPFIIIAQMPAGAIAMYKLDNTAIDVSGNGYNGSLSSTAGATNRFGTSNKATAFTANSSVGVLPLALVTALNGDFSIGFWFRSAMIASSSPQWYGGNSLIDAEVCGQTSDWGTALIDGGKVSMGIGNPDITIKSTASGYNDGNWHFVTATRKSGSGTIILYMEGVQVAISTGTNTGALNAPNSIRLGSNPCVPAGVYNGDLDDIVFYNRALSSTEVANLYNQLNAFVLPLRWVSFTADVEGNQAKLKWQVEAVENNDRFEVEHSTDGIRFSIKGTLPDGNGTTTGPGRILYTFLDEGLIKGNHFYRIRQVDRDGKYTWSKTIQLKLTHKISGFQLRSNPVADELVVVNDEQVKLLQLRVADISGRVLIDRRVQSTGSVIITGVGKLKPGYYLIQIRSVNGNKTIPWIKQ